MGAGGVRPWLAGGRESSEAHPQGEWSGPKAPLGSKHNGGSRCLIQCAGGEAGNRKVGTVYRYGATNKCACKLNGKQAFQAGLGVAPSGFVLFVLLAYCCVSL